MKINQIKKCLTIAVVFILAAAFVSASDIIAKAGDLNVTGDLDVDTNTLKVDSANNRVGIGTTSPSQKLDVVGAIELGPTTNDATNILLRGDAGILRIRNVANSAYEDLDFDNAIVRGRLQQLGSADSYFTGNVGIGTTSPASILNLYKANPILTIQDSETAAASANTTLRLAESDASAVVGNYWDIQMLAEDLVFKNLYGTLNTRMVIDGPTGNVGIGTTSPAEDLTVMGDVAINVNADSGFSLYVNASNNELIRLIRSGQSGFWDIEIDNNEHLDIGSNSKSNIINIDKSGNVGIGTASPGTKLHVKDATNDVILKLESDKTNSYSIMGFNNDARLWYTGVTTADKFYIRDQTGGNDVVLIEPGASANSLYVDSTGNVGIGTATPSHKLNVVGDVNITGELEVTGNITGAELDCYSTGWSSASACATEPEATPLSCSAGYTFVGIAAETHSDSGCGSSSLNYQKVKSRCCKIY